MIVQEFVVTKLQNIQSPKIVIFDLDGVLVDACEWHRIAFNQALEKISGYKISEKEHIEKYNGLPTATKLKMLNDSNIIIPKHNERIHNLKQDLTVNLIEENISIDHTKIELIEWLLEEKYTVACFTNSIKKTANLMLEGCGIKEYFNLIVTNEDVQNPKPDPEGYIKIIRNYNLSPNECIIVEDSPKGIAAATATGARVMMVKDATQVNKKLVGRFIHENFNTNGR